MTYRVKILITTTILCIIFGITGCISNIEENKTSSDKEMTDSNITTIDKDITLPPFSVYDESIPGGKIDGEIKGNTLILTETRFNSTFEDSGVHNFITKEIKLTNEDIYTLKEAFNKKEKNREIEQFLYYDLSQSIKKGIFVLTLYDNKYGKYASNDKDSNLETDTIKDIEKDTLYHLTDSIAYKETDIDGKRQMLLYTLKDLYDKGLIKDYLEGQNNIYVVSYEDIYGYKCEIDLNGGMKL